MGFAVDKIWRVAIVVAVSVMPLQIVKAEPYIGFSIGQVFDQKLKNLSGDENVNYPNASLSTYPNTGGAPGSALFPGAKITNLSLKDTTSLGVRLGYFFEQLPNLGVEFGVTYSHPTIKRQFVKLTHPGFNDPVNGLGLGQDNFTEDQLSAPTKLLVYSFNWLYRYQGFEKFTPYIAGGPAIYSFKVSGTGHSGIVTDPAAIADPIGVDGPSVHATSSKLGWNLRVGAEYKVDTQWSFGLEYQYSHSPIRIANFRSISNAKGNYAAQTINAELVRHF